MLRWGEVAVPAAAVEGRRAFGDGTIYPGTKSCLHSSLLDEIPMKSTLCGLLDELPFQEVADLAHMFNYDDEKVASCLLSNSYINLT